MQKKSKILILSVSAGAGHIRAAQALCSAASKLHPDVETIHLDLLDYVPKLFRKIYGESYLHMVDAHPALWGYLYAKTDTKRGDSKIRKLHDALEKLNTKKIVRVLEELAPDQVICTHFLPAQILSRVVASGEFTKPVWVVDTDFDVHSLWIQPGMTGYFVASEEVAWRMKDRNVGDAAIKVTGIPIMPAFGELLSRQTCAGELGLDPSKPTFLVMSGGAGIGGVEALVKKLMSIDGDFSVVVLCGRNAKLLADLTELGKGMNGRLLPLGFTTTVERVMAACDLAITKPGGLTTSECLAMGLPMIVVSPIPGQEERNAEYLLEHGAALKAYDLAGLEYRIINLLQNPAKIADLRQKAKALGRPDAAAAIMDTVLG